MDKPAGLQETTKGNAKKKTETFTHRQEFEVLAERGVPDAIKRLAPIRVPDQYAYVWKHFWLLWEVCGHDFSIHDIEVYARNFAPRMSSIDRLALCRVRNAANSYIDTLKEGAGMKT